MFRVVTNEEIKSLVELGNYAEDWTKVEVSSDFSPKQLFRSQLYGSIRIGSKSTIRNSSIRDYHIGKESHIEQVGIMECRSKSRFGNGVMVATMNECEGRKVMIYDRLSAQTAYLLAIYRHRPKLISRLEEMITERCEELSSEVGHVGDRCKIVGAKFIREVWVGNDVTIDGAAMLTNATLCDNSFIGIDVKGYNFIAAEGSKIDNGSIVDRCFIGECVTLDKGFSATESLLFANSHCENGEAASIFGGPYTVSHHKSSLLIAGMFSFFNAGSGSNQSNHLFKSGAVHQSVHLRGCKFASGAYIMSPALEGPFTMVLGHHSYHHDTSSFPYSYLIEKEGRSLLMPGANLTSYGAVRDIEKWPKRDKRQIKRDRINFEEYNPYICQMMIEAVNRLNSLHEEEPDAEFYTYNKVFIRPQLLERGLKLYNRAIVASIGSMLSRGRGCESRFGEGKWVDIAGEYIVKSEVESLIEAIEGGAISTLDSIERRFDELHEGYDDYAYSWALELYSKLLGHRPTSLEIEEVIEAARNAHSKLRSKTEEDRLRDCSLEMSISYGLDATTEEEVVADFKSVRGVQ